MDYKDLLKYYKNIGVLNSILKKRKITCKDVIMRNDYIVGLWDNKNNKPMGRDRVKVTIICKICGNKHNVNFRQWNNKKEENKFICASCSRSKTLSKLNKTIIRNKNLDFWSSPESKKLREQYSKARSEYNKTILRDKNLNKKRAQKRKIKKKKQITWYKRPLEERIEITNKRLIGALKGIEKNTGVRYDSSYEKFFIEEMFKNNFNICRGPVISYYFKNRRMLYYCDFIVNNNLVEIKSPYTYKKNLKKIKMKEKASKQYSKEFGYNKYIVFIIKKEHILKQEELNLDVFKS